jgi:hypothetical protein
MQTKENIRQKLSHYDNDQLTDILCALIFYSLGDGNTELSKEVSLHIETVKEMLEERGVDMGEGAGQTQTID